MEMQLGFPKQVAGPWLQASPGRFIEPNRSATAKHGWFCWTWPRNRLRATRAKRGRQGAELAKQRVHEMAAEKKARKGPCGAALWCSQGHAMVEDDRELEDAVLYRIVCEAPAVGWVGRGRHGAHGSIAAPCAWRCWVASR